MWVCGLTHVGLWTIMQQTQHLAQGSSPEVAQPQALKGYKGLEVDVTCEMTLARPVPLTL